MALVWLFGFAVPGVVHAQEAAIEGAVTDTTGFVLPGVAVEARSVETGGPAAVAFTDGAGLFSISGRVPGTYNVTFTLPGFQTNGRRGVAVGAGATVTLQVELAVQLEERVVVVGSRARPRSVTQSPVPIDAIPFRDVVSQGATSLDYQLRTLVPSFNVATHPISGAASLVRPASLRNRAPQLRLESSSILPATGWNSTHPPCVFPGRTCPPRNVCRDTRRHRRWRSP